ncbi:TniQ family protein [Micromonospora sp. WMMD961]|uniref:TniQ family protein n=1 Tax=Micromonospora sp. WMMD961 TaxID=3016100 RepID=UPI002415E66F|nr:TniQ family protein [Micromonospora sp. WMMD961]MDG4780381.1 TniQ family protein [Micromonospora sp. WMMD961]
MRSRLPRLPIPLRPAHHETLVSYVARLAAVHALPHEDLWTCLSAPTGSGRRRLIVLDRLVAATGYPATGLEHALPELRDPAPDWKQWRHYPQRACPLCTASHRGGIVRRLFAHHEMLCARHGYWIGSTEFGIDHQPRPVGTLLPELTAAQQRHNRLVRRRGWKLALHAIAASQNVCVDLRFYGPSPQHTIHDQRIKTLIPTAHAFTGPRYIAAFYPEIVRLAELFCTPGWRPTARTAIDQFAATTSSGTRGHTGDRDAIASKIADAIGYPLDAILSNNGHLISSGWPAAWATAPTTNLTRPSRIPARRPSTAPRHPT